MVFQMHDKMAFPSSESLLCHLSLNTDLDSTLTDQTISIIPVEDSNDTQLQSALMNSTLWEKGCISAGLYLRTGFSHWDATDDSQAKRTKQVKHVNI